jgi:hypothetical protein
MAVDRRRWVLRKGAVGDALVMAIFAFVAAAAFGLTRLVHGFASFRAIEFNPFVFCFHDAPPLSVQDYFCSHYLDRLPGSCSGNHAWSRHCFARWPLRRAMASAHRCHSYGVVNQKPCHWPDNF